jgi:hypothetical protein
MLHPLSSSPTGPHFAFGPAMPIASAISYTTSLKLYRPTRPPTLTTTALAQFISKLTFLEDQGQISLSLNFGPHIDADSRHPSCFDLSHPCPSLRHLIQSLTDHPAPIYRGAISLGDISPDLATHLSHAKRLLEGEELSLSQLSIEIGPVEALRLATDDHFLVGWIGLNFSGPGHVSPWQLRSFVDRASRHSDLQSLFDLCRQTWPVSPACSLPRPRYPVPWDWQWGIFDAVDALA